MKNEEVIKRILKNQEGHKPKRYTYDGLYTSTLWTRENKLINYRTVIARWANTNTIELNTKKYSSTTSKIQHKIEQVCEEYGIEIEVM